MIVIYGWYDWGNKLRHVGRYAEAIALDPEKYLELAQRRSDFNQIRKNQQFQTLILK